MEKLNFIERKMIETVGALEGDYRDWEAIQSWAEAVADDLR